MALRLVGQTSGYVEIQAHATASDNALTLPVDNGTNGQVLTTNGSGSLSFATITVPPLTALRLVGQTSGYVDIKAPATSADNTLTLPNGNGTNGQVLTTNGSGGLSFTTISVPPAGVSLGLAIALG